MTIVGEAMCVVFNVLPSWTNFLKLLTNPNDFISKIANYNLDSFALEYYNRLREYVSKKSFNPQVCNNASSVCANLCRW
jgi:hypothetical protein